MNPESRIYVAGHRGLVGAAILRALRDGGFRQIVTRPRAVGFKTDEIRRDMHNQAIMQELRQTEKELRKGLGVDETLIGKDGYPIEDGEGQAGTAAPEKTSASESGAGAPDGASASSSPASANEPPDLPDRGQTTSKGDGTGTADGPDRSTP